jgi:hypothetical protein
MRIIFLFSLCFSFLQGFAQENYEIQVYGSETVAPGTTMLELHSNYTTGGTTLPVNGLYPTHHMLHETVEVTHGFNGWFEVGFYFFNSIGNNSRTGYVGSHIRPRVRAPESWHWPVGVSLSAEFGFQKLQYSEDNWSLEIRPIVDKTLGKWYLAFNPTFEKAIAGLDGSSGFIFSPNVKTNYKLSKVWAAGFEYYGSLGNIFKLLPYKLQGNQLFAAADVDFSPDWELNFGYGWAFTKAADNGIAKVILGYRFK